MALSERFQRALGVIGASRVLSDGDKRVWEKQVYLDQHGQGSVMSAVLLGLLLGKEPETVEACRRRLMRAGLLQRSEGRGSKTRWFVRFPESWLPKMAARPSAEQYATAAADVDRLIDSALSGGPEEVPRESRVRPRDSDTPSVPRKPGKSTGFEPLSSLASVRGEGGKGGEAPQPPSSERHPLNPEISGGGGSPSERDGGGGTAVDRGDWRAVLRPGVTA